MDLGLGGRAAAVAASSRGLGRATARALAAEGASVALCGRDQARVSEAADAIARETGALQELADVRARKAGKTPDAILAELASDVPLGRVGTPEEFAAVAAFLCSERASFVNGTTIPVDGGACKGLR